MPDEKRKIYENVKNAVLTRYNYTSEGNRQRFMSYSPNKNKQTFMEYIANVQRLFK